MGGSAISPQRRAFEPTAEFGMIHLSPFMQCGSVTLNAGAVPAQSLLRATQIAVSAPRKQALLA
jgi:hypothetical protein